MSCFSTRPRLCLVIFSASSKIGDAQTGMAGNEVQHAMVCPAEAENLARMASGSRVEIAIGEEQQFGVGEQLRI